MHSLSAQHCQPPTPTSRIGPTCLLQLLVPEPSEPHRNPKSKPSEPIKNPSKPGTPKPSKPGTTFGTPDPGSCRDPSKPAPEPDLEREPGSRNPVPSRSSPSSPRTHRKSILCKDPIAFCCWGTKIKTQQAFLDHSSGQHDIQLTYTKKTNSPVVYLVVSYFFNGFFPNPTALGFACCFSGPSFFCLRISSICRGSWNGCQSSSRFLRMPLAFFRFNGKVASGEKKTERINGWKMKLPFRMLCFQGP